MGLFAVATKQLVEQFLDHAFVDLPTLIGIATLTVAPLADRLLVWLTQMNVAMEHPQVELCSIFQVFMRQCAMTLTIMGVLAPPRLCSPLVQ
jgi:hypothetical protein